MGADVSSRLLKWLAWGLLALLIGVALVVVPCVLALSGASAVSPAVVDEEAKTRYPVVLAHGMMGFDYIGRQSYWRDIPETLRAHGAQVFVTQVSSFHNSDVRGEQLVEQVRQILKETGAEKVNLIGHSHGSQSVRYVAGTHPEWVASVTSVSGPTMGSEVADRLYELAQTQAWLANGVLAAGNAVGALINWQTKASLPIDASESMRALSTSGAMAFNRRFPAGVPSQACGEGASYVDGIRYYSWSSVGQFYRASNLADYLMSATGLLFTKESQNDGLVGRCSSHLGLVIRDDYPMNHFHAVNQLSGLVGPGVDPVALYVAHARRLKDVGL